MKLFGKVFAMVLCSLLVLGALSSVLKFDLKDVISIKDETEETDEGSGDKANSLTFKCEGSNIEYAKNSTWADFAGSSYDSLGLEVYGEYIRSIESKGFLKKSNNVYVKATDMITNGTEYFVEEVVNFTIGGCEYVAKAGATWEEYCSSLYNEDHLFSLHGDDVSVTYEDSCVVWLADQSEKVSRSSVIENIEYTYGPYDGFNLPGETESPNADDENVQVDPIDPDDVTEGEHNPEDLPQIDPGESEGPGAE